MAKNLYGCGCGFKTSHFNLIVTHLERTKHKPSFGAKLLKQELAKKEKAE